MLNEPDLEHNLSPKDYTKIYDAVVSEMKKVSPATKFIGISVAFESNPEYFEYFLNPKTIKQAFRSMVFLTTFMVHPLWRAKDPGPAICIL